MFDDITRKSTLVLPGLVWSGGEYVKVVTALLVLRKGDEWEIGGEDGEDDLLVHYGGVEDDFNPYTQVNNKAVSIVYRDFLTYAPCPHVMMTY